MKVLGLDISSVSTGWAVLEDDPLTLVEYGLITCETEKNLGEKLLRFDRELTEVLRRNQDIAWIGIEDTYNNNTVTMKTLSKFAGVAIKCLQKELGVGVTYSDSTIDKALKKKRGKPEQGIFVVTPTSANKLIGLQHRLERDERKQQIVSKVNTTFKLGFTLDENDITDSIGVAMAVIVKLNGPEALPSVQDRQSPE